MPSPFPTQSTLHWAAAYSNRTNKSQAGWPDSRDSPRVDALVHEILTSASNDGCAGPKKPQVTRYRCPSASWSLPGLTRTGITHTSFRSEFWGPCGWRRQ